MKKGLLLLLFWLVSFSLANGQTITKSEVQPVEVEIGAGTGLSFYKVGFDSVTLPRYLKTEIRYNFPRSPFDVGFGVQFLRIDRKLNDHPSLLYPFPSLQLYLVSDYNWWMNDRITLFAGLAIGVSHSITLVGEPVGDYVPKSWTPYIGPRAGVELWDRLRFTMTCNLMDKGNSFMGVDVGYSFGGRKK